MSSLKNLILQRDCEAKESADEKIIRVNTAILNIDEVKITLQSFIQLLNEKVKDPTFTNLELLKIILYPPKNEMESIIQIFRQIETAKSNISWKDYEY